MKSFDFEVTYELPAAVSVMLPGAYNVAEHLAKAARMVEGLVELNVRVEPSEPNLGTFATDNIAVIKGVQVFQDEESPIATAWAAAPLCAHLIAHSLLGALNVEPSRIVVTMRAEAPVLLPALPGDPLTLELDGLDLFVDELAREVPGLVIDDPGL